MTQLPQHSQVPGAGVGAVNIQIYNPTAGMPPACPYPYPYPYMCPYPYPYPQPVQQQLPPAGAQGLNPAAQTMTPPAQNPINPEEKDKKAEKKKPIVPLTNDYLKTLENYLNNPDPEIRFMAVKELQYRFKEEPSRKNDKALTNLLNKALQDISKIRFVALMTLGCGYATGDELTYKLLQGIQKSKAAYNQDAYLASRILLERAGRHFDVQSIAEGYIPTQGKKKSSEGKDKKAKVK